MLSLALLRPGHLKELAPEDFTRVQDDGSRVDAAIMADQWALEAARHLADLKLAEARLEELDRMEPRETELAIDAARLDVATRYAAARDLAVSQRDDAQRLWDEAEANRLTWEDLKVERGGVPRWSS